MALSVLKDRRFLWMIIPNFIRGIGAGIVSILPIIAASALSMSGSEISRIAVFTYIATPIGCLLYDFLSRRIGPAGTVVIGGVLFSSFALVFWNGLSWFYAVYCIAYIGYTVVCYVIPEIIFKNTDAHRISTFQSLRMVLTTLGTTLSAAFFGNLIGTISPTVFSITATVAILFCSVCYWFCYHKSK